ncbi:hypothetical protein DFA_10241 [Cavenderia fasciculata]|uniref:Uncharacterized protein n=1 Tax=Cavenderia fasciculata TaxID=261658 RepID=F4Q9N7_CACFS|nr:uncharacterized protein DFA_10241 [Cavenderia fasciculata]EGG15406.1 hypothetical protein DFA_10241 [Cavenderia fasciculata]|eukprot:XP_004354148.1 hypothetical protein DFA_10241 [Cavenderia fasciculata]
MTTKYMFTLSSISTIVKQQQLRLLSTSASRIGAINPSYVSLPSQSSHLFKSSFSSQQPVQHDAQPLSSLFKSNSIFQSVNQLVKSSSSSSSPSPFSHRFISSRVKEQNEGKEDVEDEDEDEEEDEYDENMVPSGVEVLSITPCHWESGSYVVFRFPKHLLLEDIIETVKTNGKQFNLSCHCSIVKGRIEKTQILYGKSVYVNASGDNISERNVHVKFNLEMDATRARKCLNHSTTRDVGDIILLNISSKPPKLMMVRLRLTLHQSRRLTFGTTTTSSFDLIRTNR